MGENWTEERDKAVQNTLYYCETCNTIIEPGDVDVSTHKKDLPHHKMRRVMILRCSRCGDTVTDSNAQYSLEKNQFWCKSCLFSTSSRQEFYGESDRDKDSGRVAGNPEFSKFGAMRRWKEVAKLVFIPGKFDWREEHGFAVMPLF